jgi:hypothetical protein
VQSPSGSVLNNSTLYEETVLKRSTYATVCTRAGDVVFAGLIFLLQAQYLTAALCTGIQYLSTVCTHACDGAFAGLIFLLQAQYLTAVLCTGIQYLSTVCTRACDGAFAGLIFLLQAQYLTAVLCTGIQYLGTVCTRACDGAFAGLIFLLQVREGGVSCRPALLLSLRVWCCSSEDHESRSLPEGGLGAEGS